MDAREKQAYLRATPIQREVARRLLVEVLTLLQAQQLFYQTAGWKFGGGLQGTPPLFERMAGSTSWEAGDLAAKIVGYFGPDAISLSAALPGIQAYLARWQAPSPNPVAQALLSEEDIQAAIVRTVVGIRKVSAMTLGLENALKVLADKHEGNTLALQQDTTMSKTAHGTAERHFHDNPEKREVRQLVQGQLPPTPVEIKRGPGGEGASTLNRFVVESKDPRIAPAGPANHIRKED